MRRVGRRGATPPGQAWTGKFWLSAHGLQNVAHRHGRGVSLVTIPYVPDDETNMWVEPAHISYATPIGTRICRPVVDLHDAIEVLIKHLEEPMS